MDAISEVLRSVRLTGGLFLDARFTAPWSVLAQLTPGDCSSFMALPAQIICYHLVIEGNVLVGVEGDPPIMVGPGEVVLLPRNDTHTLSSQPGLKPVPVSELVKSAPEGGLARLVHGSGGAGTHLMCGFLSSEEFYNPLIAALPRLLKLDVRAGLSGDWIESSMRLAASELAEGRLASSPLLSRLSELLLVEAVRNYASALDDRESGWLRGLSDPQIGRALALIHQRIAAPWSAETLAREVALSRSAFVERFSTLVGTPPIRYLTQWRLRTAQLHLKETRKTIAQLAHMAGYESEEAFSRAFKREFGLPPARWRQQQAQSGEATALAKS